MRGKEAMGEVDGAIGRLKGARVGSRRKAGNMWRGVAAAALSLMLAGKAVGEASGAVSQPTAPQTSPSTGNAKQGVGAAGVQPSAGFGCPSGLIWNPAAPWLGCKPPPANCVATPTTSGICTFVLPATSHGSTASASTTLAGASGSISATCNDGGWANVVASCSPASCNGGGASAGACSFSLSPTGHGGQQTVGTSTPGYSGSLTASCYNGTWSALSSSCTAQMCSAGPISWIVGGQTCSGALPATGHGASAVATNATASFSGSAQFTCSAGAWTGPTAATCAAIAAPPPGTKTTYTGNNVYNCTWYGGGTSEAAFYDTSGGTNNWSSSMTVYRDGRRTQHYGQFSPEVKDCTDSQYWDPGVQYFSELVLFGDICSVAWDGGEYWLDRLRRDIHVYQREGAVYVLKTVSVDPIMSAAIIEIKPYSGGGSPSLSLASCPR